MVQIVWITYYSTGISTKLHVTGQVKAEYDGLSELETFDETKAGVKGFVDTAILLRYLLSSITKLTITLRMVLFLKMITS